MDGAEGVFPALIFRARKRFSWGRQRAFDLVILDEASQSDAREMPALLRGKKVLVVGDDRQVSPSAAFLSIANIERLRENFLSDFPFRSQVEPGASLYDLARVVFPDRFVMLKEHFHCVGSGSI
jgi:superfamily I DNA and/or RNA helicase